MFLQVEYINILAERNQISQYHVWDFDRDQLDYKWLKEIIKKNDRFIFFSVNNKHSWKEYYQYYAHRQKQFQDSIMIKLDDDIVYLDINKFSNFIKFRREHSNFFIVSANVINNGVCAYFQQKHGCIPKELMELEYPSNGFCGSLWENGEKAYQLHQYFINHSDCFSWQGYTAFSDRLSINFISWLGKRKQIY